MGDLNARIGVDKTQLTDIPILENLIPQDLSQIPTRSSCDFNTNRYGKKLRQLCQGHGLVVANGRTPGDQLGNFTCYNNRGASVVDFVICDRPLFKKFKKMKVQAPIFSSAYTPIELI